MSAGAAGEPGRAVRVALVDDHAVLRDGLRALFAAATDLQVVGEAGSLAEARARVAGWGADVITLDLALGDGDGLDLLAALPAPPPAIVVLTMVDAPAKVDRALRAGVRGWVQKGRSSERLLAAVRAAARGEVWLDEAVAPLVLRGYLGQGRSPADALTTREREIVALVAAGLTSDEIGRRLGVAAKTVQNHRSRVLEKLGLRTTAALVRWAIEQGVV